MVLIKVDRNGTKYYTDDTCQRCGGAGQRSEWYYTGLTCFECGGTGRSRTRLIKEYTPEYAATLQARRDEREAKKLGYASAEEMKAARIAEAARKEAEQAAEEERREAERKAEEERVRAAKAVSKYIGEVGEKIALTATYEGSPRYTRRDMYGRPETVYIHRFRDADGNLIVWRTGTFPFKVEEGAAVALTGTVKGHDEYKDERQTAVIRCKVKEA